jgi:hypothetical protein
MRFSLRDLFWATALIALAVAWWMDNQTKTAAVQQAHRLHQSLSLAKQWHDLGRGGYYFATGAIPASAVPASQPDWAALEEPLVQP